MPKQASGNNKPLDKITPPIQPPFPSSAPPSEAKATRKLKVPPKDASVATKPAVEIQLSAPKPAVKKPSVKRTNKSTTISLSGKKEAAPKAKASATASVESTR